VSANTVHDGRGRTHRPAATTALPEDATVPTYQYACTACDHAFEQFQSFSDDALTECPQCGGRLRKLFNAVGVVFKGSGFYRTDSRSSGTSPSGSSESKGATTTTEKKADSKPAASTSSPAS
jgi:putative FmdB family regulatory protein